MKKLLILAAICLLAVGCSSKTVKWDSLGRKSVITKTDAAADAEAQAKAIKAYYMALANPPVIATFTQPDGSVITIHSQIPPPLPTIRQYESQWAKPIESMVNTGIKIIGGGRVITKALDTMQGIQVNNMGSGSVTVDRSSPIQTEIVHAEDGSTINQDSNKDLSDHHIEKADPVIVEHETVQVVETERVQVVETEVVHEVRPEIVNPVVVNPVVVDKDVVVVEPTVVTPEVANPVVVQPQAQDPPEE